MLKYNFFNLVTSAILVFVTFICPGSSYAAHDTDINRGIVLIVASYNPDTKRMSEFITDFESQIIKKKYGYQVLIEDMGCKGIDEAAIWDSKLTDLLGRYVKKDLRAVIFLGQEAWASFMLQNDFPKDIPFFGCFASQNGIILSIDSTINTSTWQAESVDMQSLAKSKGMAGGVLNIYNVKKNLELIKTLYPNSTNIAFVSDNTYGGLSLQALVRKEIKAFPELTLTTIDSREIDPDKVSQAINQLPNNSVLLIGTWRVDGSGVYFLSSAINSLVPSNIEIPVFSLSGTGIGSVAMGGYIPSYSVDATSIADQIYDYHSGNIDSVYFDNKEGHFLFDKQMLRKMGIQEYQLPKGSVVENKVEAQLEKYQKYIIWALLTVVILTMFIVVLYRMYYRNKKLKDSLIENEKQLIISKENAEESGRLKSAFLANMSHEIRTPLNAIVGFSTLLCDDSIPIESKEEYSKIIMTNSNLLLTLINDILDISRLDTGKVSFDFKDEELDVICRQVISTTEHLRNRDVELIYNPPKKPIYIETDMQRLSQVLINLITNANKFTEQGTITVECRVDQMKHMAYISVADTGCGIPKEMQAKVFNRFEKLNEYKQGTGLGLAICEQIVSRFGGKIWIDPDYTGGTKFVFSHPLHQPHEDK